MGSLSHMDFNPGMFQILLLFVCGHCNRHLAAVILEMLWSANHCDVIWVMLLVSFFSSYTKMKRAASPRVRLSIQGPKNVNSLIIASFNFVVASTYCIICQSMLLPSYYGQQITYQSDMSELFGHSPTFFTDSHINFILGSK